ncbi:MAG: glycogen/starch synthase [Prevotellaceae bacterium]|jgi:glycosyltransferase involved in cell wall biosynthesis|nr:glycogen/starch synthase [Prevotellaceae bacterium]
MTEKLLTPNYVFETSWEVCNKVGGIYTALSTRARTLNITLKNKLMFIGPDIWGNSKNPNFIENHLLMKEWRRTVKEDSGLDIRLGRWNIPGRPVAILIDYRPLFEEKNEIYGDFWSLFGVESLKSYGDYDDSCLFAYAAGVIINHYYHYFKLYDKKVVAHFNEWQTCFGELYLKKHNPAIGTIFTTHATSVGRSIAEHNKPLYDFLQGFYGDQMAQELNVQAKHSAEKTAAKYADCFTTVSQITARECAQLLERPVDVVLPNGFEADFVPKGQLYRDKWQEARNLLTRVAEILTGKEYGDDVLFVGTSGRYEYKNKGIDVFIDALKLLSERKDLTRDVVAFIMTPAWISGPRQDLIDRLQNPYSKIEVETQYVTHNLFGKENDPVINQSSWQYGKQGKVKVIFVPSYLDEKDGIFNKSYYDLLIGFDITVFPSYYEPWGYTPLESAAFGIPTITTDLSGFGQWVLEESKDKSISNGVAVVHRTDDNYLEVAEQISQELFDFSGKTARDLKLTQKMAFKISQKALWKHFIEYYYKAYHTALSKK